MWYIKSVPFLGSQGNLIGYHRFLDTSNFLCLDYPSCLHLKASKFFITVIAVPKKNKMIYLLPFILSSKYKCCSLVLIDSNNLLLSNSDSELYISRFLCLPNIWNEELPVINFSLTWNVSQIRYFLFQPFPIYLFLKCLSSYCHVTL